MELIILRLVALLRPLGSIKHAETLFSVIGVGLFGLLSVALLMHGAIRKTLRTSSVDGAILAFTVWCLAIAVIYYEDVHVAEVGKLLIPLLSYTIVKNVIRDRREHRRLLAWMVAGFCVPTLMSALLIGTGTSAAIQSVNYWTAVARWQGVYDGAHNLGHSMTLLLMTLVLYVIVGEKDKPDKRGGSAKGKKWLLVLLATIALYCLYKSQVRTAVLGLLTFVGILTYTVSKKAFLLGATVLGILAIGTSSYWLTAFNPELGAEAHGEEVDAMKLGSGRPRLWLNDIKVFAGRPIDEKLAGAGIGNRAGDGDGGRVYGHNDWLELVTQTGLIGVLLFATLQAAIFRKILRMQGVERFAFMAFFVAVNLMMLISNSYAWRIQVSQLYYMVLAFIEIPPALADREAGTEERALRAI